MNEHDEAWLRELPLRGPSASLDTKIEKLIAAQALQTARPRNFTWWQCAAACAACVAATYFGVLSLAPRRAAPADTAPVTTEVHYIVQTQQQPYDMFDWTKYPKKVAPNSMMPVRQTATTNHDAI